MSPVVTKIVIPLINGEKETVMVVPPRGWENYEPTIHRDDKFPIFGSLSDGEEEYVASDGTVWHIDWRPK